MNRVRHILKWMRKERTRRDRKVGCVVSNAPLSGAHLRCGTVLMECVLVLPILTLLVFAIVQFSLIWYAQIMTHYAAYNAARAALVYHPGEYREVDGKKRVLQTFKTDSGVCWEAACRTLAWVSNSPSRDSGGQGERGGEIGIPGWYTSIPNSSSIGRQVRIVQNENDSVEMTNAPVVRVTVEFDCPLHVPVIGHMLAMLDNLGNNNSIHETMGVDFIKLRGTAILPKLWRTSHFARRPETLSWQVLNELTLMQFDEEESGLARTQK